MGGNVAPELAGNALEQYNLNMFFMVGRMKPTATLAGAEAELDTVSRQLDRDHGVTDRDEKHRRVLLVDGGKLLPLRKQDVPFFTSFLTIMASLIMMIACANVATMMLARAAGRRKEMAVRLALGASRIRLIRQLLTESMMLAVVAGAAGFAGSAWLMSLSSQIRMPFPMPVTFDFHVDGQVLLLNIVLTLATGLTFGLAPALQATRTDVAPALKDDGNLFYGTHRRLSFRNVLMVSQVAGSLTLLVLIGLLAFGIQTTLGMEAASTPGTSIWCRSIPFAMATRANASRHFSIRSTPASRRYLR